MDRRVTKTRAAIKKAYLELIVEKGQSKISVSELSRRADIDRKTFYLHYSSTYDVLADYVGERFSEIVDAMEESRFFENPFNGERLIMLLDKFYQEEEELLIAIAEGDEWDDLWNQVHDMLAEKVIELYVPLVNMDKGKLRICFDFFGGGVIDVYRRWVKGDYSEDLYGIVEMVSEIAQTGLNRYFDK